MAAASRPVLAENSITSYRAFLRKFGSWAGQHGYNTAVPVDQAVIGAWLLDLAKRGTAVSSINVALAAVRWTHEQADKPFQRSVGLTNIMQRIRREYATTPDQAAPLKPAMLAGINIDAGQTMLGMRDSALLSLAYLFATAGRAGLDRSGEQRRRRCRAGDDAGGSHADHPPVKDEPGGT